MKKCPQCKYCFDGEVFLCKKCGFAPELRDGMEIFAIHNDGTDNQYNPAWYAELAALEAGNFWFLARNRLIEWLISKHIRCSDAQFMEIGCGTGFVLQMICRSNPKWKCCGSEYHNEGIHFARNRVPDDVVFFQMDARSIPFDKEFDVIGAFDVIEHIEDDIGVIAEVFSALKAGGFFLVSVPQHQFLWSRYDEVGCHFRRYSRIEIHTKIEQAGFEIIDSTSFNALLLPLMFISRMFKKRKNIEINVLDELRISHGMNRLLSFVLLLEYVLVRFGIRWPLGGSRIVLARKV